MNDIEIIHDIIYNFLHSFDNTTLQISKNNKSFMAVDDQKNKENNGSSSPSTLSQNKNSSSKLLKDLEYILNEIKNNSFNKKIEKQEIRTVGQEMNYSLSSDTPIQELLVNEENKKEEEEEQKTFNLSNYIEISEDYFDEDDLLHLDMGLMENILNENVHEYENITVDRSNDELIKELTHNLVYSPFEYTPSTEEESDSLPTGEKVKYINEDVDASCCILKCLHFKKRLK